jgi:hypothetical protein
MSGLRMLLAGGGILALAACSSAGMQGSQDFVPTPYELSAGERSTVEAAVTRTLKDPTSPIFGSIVGGIDRSGGRYACGFVNAKNSFGGYTGDTPFEGSFTADGFKVGFMGWDTVAPAVCKRLGMSEPR